MVDRLIDMIPPPKREWHETNTSSASKCRAYAPTIGAVRNPLMSCVAFPVDMYEPLHLNTCTAVNAGG